jgi:probable rRNA maturation factor
LDKAYEQAVSFGHSNLRELSFLMIHGFLHLLGYDHMEDQEEKEMFDRQEVILNEFGIKR